MSNIRNYYFKNIDAKLVNSEYYDFYLSSDEYSRTIYDGIISGDTLAFNFDFNNPNTFADGEMSAQTIYSLSTWTGATNTGYTITTVGLTGIDNGLVTFDKESGDTSNQALLSALTGTTLVIPSGDYRFSMFAVTGMSGDYIYPMELVKDDFVGDYVNFCGGFYQGFYKLDGYSYKVLPTRVPKAWVAEFWMRRGDSICSGVTAMTSGLTATTLNEKYPENKGFFFYMGTRAENKFWNQFAGLNTAATSGCTSGATEWCTIPKEEDIIIEDERSGFGIPLNPPQIEIREISNQFLIYGRANGNRTSCGTTKTDGLGTKGACDFPKGGTIFVADTKKVVTDDRNPFLVYMRGGGGCDKCGKRHGATTACDFSGFTTEQLELPVCDDTFDNALGFRITDDGEIGYKYLTYTCSTADTKVVKVVEGYSEGACIPENEWFNIVIRFILNERLEGCDLETMPPRKGKLMFYVNYRLKYVVEDFPEFIARRLEEHYTKQVGVPFNISIGGGTQGLIDSMTFDGQDPNDLGLCIERNFAGTFIGSISQVRFYVDDLNWCDLKNNGQQERERYGLDEQLNFGCGGTIAGCK